ncbi:MAG: ankyrin repeat domain-containing protein, partial [Solirubrobacterales bacterium]
NRAGATPLHLAAFEGREDVVKQLADARADLRLKDSDGDDPIHEAARRGHRNVVEYLAGRGVDAAEAMEVLKTGTTALHLAAAEGNLKQVKTLLSRGANVNSKDRADARPLYYAAEEGRKDIAELLVAHGANIRARNGRHNETPRQAAVRALRMDVAVFLQACEAGSTQPQK